MKNIGFKTTLLIVLATIVLLSAAHSSGQDAEWTYKQKIEKALSDRQSKKYKSAANEATLAFNLADQLDNVRKARAKAIDLSISANAAAKNSGVEFNGPWSIIILKDEKLLLLLEKGTICRRFDIAIGEEYSVPAGRFRVGAKLGYPNLDLNGTFYKMGEPGNMLGSRWIELRNPEGVPVTGIHGESMLKQEGLEPLFFCLKNADVNEIFGLLKEGSDVEVK